MALWLTLRIFASFNIDWLGVRHCRTFQTCQNFFCSFLIISWAKVTSFNFIRSTKFNYNSINSCLRAPSCFCYVWRRVPSAPQLVSGRSSSITIQSATKILNIVNEYSLKMILGNFLNFPPENLKVTRIIKNVPINLRDPVYSRMTEANTKEKILQTQVGLSN